MTSGVERQKRGMLHKGRTHRFLTLPWDVTYSHARMDVFPWYFEEELFFLLYHEEMKMMAEEKINGEWKEKDVKSELLCELY